MSRRRFNTLPPPIARAAPFPRPRASFVGREGELARLRTLLDDESLFVVYGVGGIGKSELVFRVIEEARQRPELDGAAPILVTVPPGTSGEQLVGLLQLRLGALGPPSMSGALAESRRGFGDDLAEVARALEESPTLLFIDDLHHAEPEAAGRLLAFLGRHVRASRVFAAARAEIPLPADAPSPVVVRLGPMDAAAVSELARAVALRLGLPPERAAAAEARAGGSPFYLQRALADAGPGSRSGDRDPIAAAVADLPADARQALLLAALLRGRVSADELGALVPGGAATLAEPTRRFFLDVDRDVVLVHDLVASAVLAATPPAELARAQQQAASALALRFVTDPGGAVLDGVEAAALSLAAGAPEQAWALLERGVHAIAGAGVDHLLLPTLAVLRDALPAQRLAIDLLRARTLVRRSHIAQAEAALAASAAEPGAATSVRYLLMRGLVAQHLGDLARAEALFARAESLATVPAERYRAQLSRAVVAAWRGDAAGCRRFVAEAEAHARGAGGELGPRERARLAWAEILNLVFELRFDDAAALGQRTLDMLSGVERADDLRLMIAMITTLAAAESDDLGHAQGLFDSVVAPAARSNALREQLAALYRGVILWSEGHVREARTELHATFAALVHHQDHLHACLAGHYLAQVLAALGDRAGALDVATRTAAAAETAGLGSLAPFARACEAQLLAAVGRSAEARDVAATAYAAPAASWGTRLRAAIVLARGEARAPAHDLEGARRMLAETAVDAPRTPSVAACYWLAEAELAVAAGDVASARAPAEAARHHYARTGRHWFEARALVALAAPPDGDAEAFRRARELAAEQGYAGLAARLARGLAGAGAGPGALPGAPREAGALAGAAAGAGLADAAASPRARARREHDLVVEVDQGRIVAGRGERAVKGRPVACALLARLIAAGSAGASAEQLYLDVWGGREYHPLRHRNTVYVGVNRLRALLRELLPDGGSGAPAELVETLPLGAGWRLSPGVRAHVFAGDDRPELK